MPGTSTVTFSGTTRQPNPYDAHIGARLRAARTLAGVSQERLGLSVGLSFQQIQKYEKGLNRIGGSRLQQFAQILNLQPAYFFEDMPTGHQNAPLGVDLHGDTPALPVTNLRREHLELVRSYDAIPSDQVRHAVRALIKQLAKAGAEIGEG